MILNNNTNFFLVRYSNWLESCIIKNKLIVLKMNRISREEVSKVAQLAKLKLNEEQIDNHAIQIEKILDYINQLEKIDTTNVPCTTRAIEVINNFRSDANVTYKNRDEILNLAPSRENDFFKVPKIIKD